MSGRNEAYEGGEIKSGGPEGGYRLAKRRKKGLLIISSGDGDFPTIGKPPCPARAKGSRAKQRGARQMGWVGMAGAGPGSLGAPG